MRCWVLATVLYVSLVLVIAEEKLGTIVIEDETERADLNSSDVQNAIPTLIPAIPTTKLIHLYKIDPKDPLERHDRMVPHLGYDLTEDKAHKNLFSSGIQDDGFKHYSSVTSFVMEGPKQLETITTDSFHKEVGPYDVTDFQNDHHKLDDDDLAEEIHYHQHNHLHRHKHMQEHLHNHNQQHRHDHGHAHEHQGNHGHKEQSYHQHSHQSNHHHGHKGSHHHQHRDEHKHGHEGSHKHDHQHQQQHKHEAQHGHQHQQLEEHQHKHESGQKHQHHHGHKHESRHQHKHEHGGYHHHEHWRKGSHDHPPKGQHHHQRIEH